MEQTKITVKLYEPLLNDFNNQVNRIFIKRDAFLNHVIKSELPHLAEDIASFRQSNKARQYIAGELKKLGTHTINVVVDKQVSDDLDKIVKNSNMVRDAFINRLVMLLRSTKALKFLGLPMRITEWDFKGVDDPLPTTPLEAIEIILNDPLYYLRQVSFERHECGLYQLPLPKKFVGFSCYLADEEVPNTEEYRKSKRLEEEFLNSKFDADQEEAFGTGEAK